MTEATNSAGASVPAQLNPYLHANKHSRHATKRDAVLTWLSTFHYSTRQVLSKLLGIEAAGQYNFFSRLIKNDLIRTFSIGNIREELILLTPNGLEHARALTERALVYNLDPARIGSARVIHTLAVQVASLLFTTDYQLIDSERHMTFADRLKRPDAVLTLPEQRLALEIELNHKNSPRIYRAYYDSIQNIKGGFYDHVHYVFPNDALRKTYLRHFEQPSWPIYERDRSMHLLRPKKVNGVQQSLNADDPRVRALFTFVTERLYP